ncbi:hypothetical protein yc1106_03672 [Curvularia clavata]|uniref:Uncharacterized protein n=1 Tax=Curvularia clavata TaxID=95742 RepID=A0A9Q8Z9Q3_CURCL|nr:hypothetical protein yc1106_03672 [Curvularia clavata]
MRVSTIIPAIPLMMPAIQAQFCNRNTPLVYCLSVKNHGCCIRNPRLCPDTPEKCCDESYAGSVDNDKSSLAVEAKAARSLSG